MISPLSVTGMITTDPGCRITSALSSCPFGNVIVSIWTVKILPSNTFLMSRCTMPVVRGSPFMIHDSRFLWRPTGQVLEHAHQVIRQRCDVLHAAVVARMVEDEPCDVEEWSGQSLHRLDVRRD